MCELTPFHFQHETEQIVYDNWCLRGTWQFDSFCECTIGYVIRPKRIICEMWDSRNRNICYCQYIKYNSEQSFPVPLVLVIQLFKCKFKHINVFKSDNFIYFYIDNTIANLRIPNGLCRWFTTAFTLWLLLYMMRFSNKLKAYIEFRILCRRHADLRLGRIPRKTERARAGHRGMHQQAHRRDWRDWKGRDCKVTRSKKYKTSQDADAVCTFGYFLIGTLWSHDRTHKVMGIYIYMGIFMVVAIYD